MKYCIIWVLPTLLHSGTTTEASAKLPRREPPAAPVVVSCELDPCNALLARGSSAVITLGPSLVYYS